MVSTYEDRISGVSTSVAIKAPVVVETNADITLSGEQTVNSVAVVVDDRVLVKDKIDKTKNGIYDVKLDEWTRSLDFNGTRDAVQGTIIPVYGSNTYEVTTSEAIVFDTTEITFAVRSISGAISNVVDDLSPQAGGNFDMNARQDQWSKGADVVCASSLPLLTDGNYFDITSGDNTVISINTTGGAGTVIKVHCDVDILWTHHATNVVLPGGANIQSIAGDELEFVEYDTGTYRLTGRTESGGLHTSTSINDFRLTLTSGTSVTTSDVSGAGTVYMALHTGNQITLYTGDAWVTVTSPELSVAASTEADKVFDIFCDYNAGTPQLVTTDWTNDTTPAIALTRLEGKLVQTGNLDWRYLGTARTRTASEVNDTKAFRHLWNYHNRVQKKMERLETTNTWTYTTATVRQANGSTANQLDFVIGVAEDSISTNVFAESTNSGSNHRRFVGIGYDSTSVLSGVRGSDTQSLAGAISTFTSFFKVTPTAGRHFIAWLEYSIANNTTTWIGDNGGTEKQSGIQGTILC